jgi:hypothetical protein
MTELPRFGLKEAGLLLLILALAAAARAWYLAEGADMAQHSGPLLVQGEDLRTLNDLADNLSKYRWFGSRYTPFSPGDEQTAHVAPGYPWLYSRLGQAFDHPATVTRWIQCGLGTLTAALYFLFARRVFRSTFVGTLAGLLAALHPFWVVNTAELNDGVLATFLVAGCLFLGARASQVGEAFTSFLYGLTLAGLTLVRAALLPFAFVAVVWFLLRCRTLTRGWLCALLAFLGFVNGLIPWTLRNFQVFGEVLPIVDTTYVHLWMGYNPSANGGPQDEATMLQELARVRGESVSTTQGWLADAKKKQPARYNSKELADALLQVLSEDSARAIEQRLRAGLCFLFGADWFGPSHKVWQEVPLETGEVEKRVSGLLTPPAAGPLALLPNVMYQPRAVDRMPEWFQQLYKGLLYSSLLGMLLLGLLGWRWSYGWRKSGQLLALAFVWIPLPYLLSHAEALSGPRLPFDGVLICYTAFALACLVPGVGRALFAGEDSQRET